MDSVSVEVSRQEAEAFCLRRLGRGVLPGPVASIQPCDSEARIAAVKFRRCRWRVPQSASFDIRVAVHCGRWSDGEDELRRSRRIIPAFPGRIGQCAMGTAQSVVIGAVNRGFKNYSDSSINNAAISSGTDESTLIRSTRLAILGPCKARQPVSIVVTVLNEAEDIGRGVASLLAQEPSATEVIVVDGGSTDGTWEWLAAMQAKDPRLVAIRDETCSLKYSPGPVSRGRNVAIAAARTGTIATADAGCTYAPDWLANLTAPLVAGKAEYALGGSCLDPADHTVWDVASAPFFSIKLGAEEPTKSCTARSMAFTKALWERIGGFPEAVLVGEDTLFDFDARRLTTPAFVATPRRSTLRAIRFARRRTRWRATR